MMMKKSLHKNTYKQKQPEEPEGQEGIEQHYKHFDQSSEEEQEPNGEDCEGHSQYLQRICRSQH